MQSMAQRFNLFNNVKENAVTDPSALPLYTSQTMVATVVYTMVVLPRVEMEGMAIHVT